MEEKQRLLAKLSLERRAKYPNKTLKAVKRKERPKRKVTLNGHSTAKGRPGGTRAKDDIPGRFGFSRGIHGLSVHLPPFQHV